MLSYSCNSFPMPPTILTSYKGTNKTRSQGPTKPLQDLCFCLQITTTNTSAQLGTLLNRFEEENSQITSLNAGPLERYDPILNDLFELTSDEKAEIGFVGNKLTLESIWRNRNGRLIKTRRTHKSNKGFFTITQLVKIIVKFERIDRPKSNWFGGVDCHHIYFEGLRLNKTKDAFSINWGS